MSGPSADPGTTASAREGRVIERTRISAYTWCEASDAVLLCRLRMDDPDPGAWTLPGGGLDFGEDPVDGALRELGEETGLEARIDSLAGIRSEVFEPEVDLERPPHPLRGHRLPRDDHAAGRCATSPTARPITPSGSRLRDSTTCPSSTSWPGRAT